MCRRQIYNAASSGHKTEEFNSGGRDLVYEALMFKILGWCKDNKKKKN